ncbi:YppF family protein [Falsibacillus albus]|uniref:YppF family protein n=1 Tax=Falsibacillus albus TaxID=2478915 RepID=A0A3L7JX88_9BACI|nr:YppF family protein [Falsibacillus albus]RLQ95140.1 hypothetical protein D9X91_11615 [Falsibacillus albus]
MNVQQLKELFKQKRSFDTEDVNELLDFAKYAYIHNELSGKQYRRVVGELESEGASLPPEGIIR